MDYYSEKEVILGNDSLKLVKRILFEIKIYFPVFAIFYHLDPDLWIHKLLLIRLQRAKLLRIRILRTNKRNEWVTLILMVCILLYLSWSQARVYRLDNDLSWTLLSSDPSSIVTRTSETGLVENMRSRIWEDFRNLVSWPNLKIVNVLSNLNPGSC